MGLIERALDRLQWIAERLIILAFAIMVLSILATVFTRNISISITWFEELSRFMMIWLVGLGFAVALRAGMLSGAEIALIYLPTKAARAAVFAAKLIVLIISVLVLKSGWALLSHLHTSGQMASNLQVPMTWVYFGLWLGFFLTIVFTAGSLLLETLGHRDLMARSFAASATAQSASSLDDETSDILSEVVSADPKAVEERK